jgi:hypothetical protein
MMIGEVFPGLAVIYPHLAVGVSGLVKSGTGTLA